MQDRWGTALIDLTHYLILSYDLVRRAAREAVDMFDMLIICGFAFAPEVDDTRLNFGNLTVLKSITMKNAVAGSPCRIINSCRRSATCNAAHSVEARLSRWLLRAHDLNGTHTLLFTHEFLAEMLGVRRTSVSLVANLLQQAGLIKYRRGQIQITNMEALQEASCECHETELFRYTQARKLVRQIAWTAWRALFQRRQSDPGRGRPRREKRHERQAGNDCLVHQTP